jgi:hypothetical protein
MTQESTRVAACEQCGFEITTICTTSLVKKVNTHWTEYVIIESQFWFELKHMK